eukprot:scaffold19898_cov34-Tisochrysis_lutea.AAC.6
MTSHPEVAECCVVGAADDLKGQLPLGLLVLTGSARTSPEDVEAQVWIRIVPTAVSTCSMCAQGAASPLHPSSHLSIVQMVREHIGPVAAFKHAIVLPALPKTRSGKILRGLLLKLADGQTATPPATLEDPEVFQEAARVISERWRAGREKRHDASLLAEVNICVTKKVMVSPPMQRGNALVTRLGRANEYYSVHFHIQQFVSKYR